MYNLPNETKIHFCNAMNSLLSHLDDCDECCEYIEEGSGDLCNEGKEIIAKEMAYSDTNIKL